MLQLPNETISNQPYDEEIDNSPGDLKKQELG